MKKVRAEKYGEAKKDEEKTKRKPKSTHTWTAAGRERNNGGINGIARATIAAKQLSQLRPQQQYQRRRSAFTTLTGERMRKMARP